MRLSAALRASPATKIAASAAGVIPLMRLAAASDSGRACIEPLDHLVRESGDGAIVNTGWQSDLFIGSQIAQFSRLSLDIGSITPVLLDFAEKLGIPL